MAASLAESFLVDPIAVGVEFGFGERLVESDVVKFTEFAGLLPRVAFDF